MADTAAKAREFRRLHEGPLFVIPNPWDAGSARLLAGLGFRALATSSAASAIACGLRDGGMTRERALAHCREVVAATALPVSADLENGFGDAPEEAAETIRQAGGAGLAGASIEDTAQEAAAAPYEFTLAVERVAAAAEAARRLGFPFVLTARTENYLRGKPDLDDTIRRLQAFEAAGADVLFAPGVPTLDAVRTVCAALKKPFNFMAAVPGKAFALPDLAAAGVRRVSLGASLHRAALGAFLAAAREVRDQGTFRYTDAMPAGADVYRLMAGGPGA